MAAEPSPSRRSPSLVWLARGLAVALAVIAGAVGIVANHHEDLCQDTLHRAGRVKSGTTAAEADRRRARPARPLPSSRDAVTPIALLIGAHHARRGDPPRRGPDASQPRGLRGLAAGRRDRDNGPRASAALRRVDQLRKPL